MASVQLWLPHSREAAFQRGQSQGSQVETISSFVTWPHLPRGGTLPGSGAGNAAPPLCKRRARAGCKKSLLCRRSADWKMRFALEEGWETGERHWCPLWRGGCCTSRMQPGALCVGSFLEAPSGPSCLKPAGWAEKDKDAGSPPGSASPQTLDPGPALGLSTEETPEQGGGPLPSSERRRLR